MLILSIAVMAFAVAEADQLSSVIYSWFKVDMFEYSRYLFVPFRVTVLSPLMTFLWRTPGVGRAVLPTVWRPRRSGKRDPVDDIEVADLLRAYQRSSAPRSLDLRTSARQHHAGGSTCW